MRICGKSCEEWADSLVLSVRPLSFCEIQLKLQGLFSYKYICIRVCVCASVLSGLMTVSQYMNETSKYVWIRQGCRYVWVKISCLCFHSRCTVTVSYLKGWRTLLHGTSSSFWYSSWIQSVRWSLFAQDVLGRNITYMAADFFFLPKALLSI